MSQREPVVVAQITALVVAVLALAVSFGVDLSADQRAAIVAVVGSVGSLVAAVWARGKMTPT